MNQHNLKDGFGWGVLLWLIGYVVGIVFFMILPPSLIGVATTPIGVAITLFVLLKKIRAQKLSDYLTLSVIWTFIAIVFDYLFIVKLFKSTNYYKWDIWPYYSLTFLMPLAVGWKKKKVRWNS